jgi:hypothetical protein
LLEAVPSLLGMRGPKGQAAIAQLSSSDVEYDALVTLLRCSGELGVDAHLTMSVTQHCIRLSQEATVELWSCC